MESICILSTFTMHTAIPIAVGITAGVGAHHGFFKHGEWHMSTPNILASHLMATLSALYLLYNHLGSLHDALGFVASGSSSYLAALFTSMTVYRLFFHQTSHFPGPRLAAVTKFYHIWYIRDSRNYMYMQKLHERYGDFVRTGV